MDKIEITLKPDTDIKGGGELLTQILINGNPYEFLFDTGCRLTSLRTDSYTRDLPSKGVDFSGGAFSESLEARDLILIEEIQVGPIQKKAATISRVDSSAHRNLLGMDLIEEKILKFRLKEGFIVIQNTPDDAATMNLLESREPQPRIPVKLGDRQGTCLWDTGAGATCIDLKLAESLPEKVRKIGETKGVDSTNNMIHTPIYEVSDLEIGGKTFPTHLAVGFDFSPINRKVNTPINVILGITTMINADWVFNFPERKWGISKLHG